MKLTWTKTDEAPALASYALLPILRAYFKGTGLEIETADISLAGRIIANFPECLPEQPEDSRRVDPPGEAGARPRRPTSLSSPTSAPRFRNSGKRLRNFRGKGYNIPIIPRSRLRKRSVRCRPAFRWSWARP